MAELGRVWADNVLDRASQNSIRHGFVAGEGLLGELWEAIQRLEQAAADAAHFQEEPYYGNLLDARLAAFEAIERVEALASRRGVGGVSGGREEDG